MSALYDQLDEVSTKIKEDNDCTVMTLACVTGASYENAHAALEAAGRQRGEGAALEVLFTALKALGHTTRRHWSKHTLRLEVGADARVTSASPAVGDGDWSVMPTMILNMTRHVAAFRAGEVHDWSDERMVPVLDAWEIVPIRHNAPAPAPDVVYLPSYY